MPVIDRHCARTFWFVLISLGYLVWSWDLTEIS